MIRTTRTPHSHNMKIRPLFVVIVGLGALVALGAGGLYARNKMLFDSTAKTLRDAVVKDFHDPDTARFRNVKLRSHEPSIAERFHEFRSYGTKMSVTDRLPAMVRYDPDALELCGEVNAKNGFGAYVGYRTFWIATGGKLVPFIDTKDGDKFAKEMCDIDMTVVLSDPQ